MDQTTYYTVPTRIIRTLENCVLLTIEGQWNGKFVIRVEEKAITTNRSVQKESKLKNGKRKAKMSKSYLPNP